VKEAAKEAEEFAVNQGHGNAKEAETDEKTLSDLRSMISEKVQQLDKTLVELNTLFDGKIDVLKNKHQSKPTETQRVNSVVAIIEQKVYAREDAETMKYKLGSIEKRLKKLQEG